MVRYTENSFEKLVNKLVFISIFAILIILFLDLLSLLKDSFTNPLAQYSVSLGLAINIVFLTDLVLIFRKRDSVWSFVKHNWLDIIAVLPLDLFRVAKVARVAKLARFSRVAKEGKIFKLLPKVIYLRGAKVFSKETDFNKQLEKTRDKLFDMKLKRKDSEMKKLSEQINKMAKD